MKKKLLLITLMIALFICVFVISASATNYVPAFGEMTKVEGMAEKATFGNDGKFDTCTSRVLMDDGITYPAYYIYDDSTTHTVDFAKLNSATGKSYDRNTVICLEIPEGVTTLPNCFNAKGSAIFWGDKYTSTIEYLKFSSTITSMSTDATIFSMKNLKCLDMSLSKVETIPTRGVQGASALTEIYFPATLKTLSETSFLGCSSLAYVDFTNTLLEDIGLRAFFECYMLEEVKLGMHIKKLQTQCFYKAGINSDKGYVEYYISGALEEIYNQYGQIMQDAKTAVIFYTGTNEDTGFAVLHSNALKSGAANWATVDAKGESFDENATYTANTIIYNYNSCKAFYNGEHLEDTNPCLIECTRCKLADLDPNATHDFNNKITYENYYKNGTATRTCSTENCPYHANPLVDNTLSPLFNYLGFSSNGVDITVGYTVNTDAYDAFVSCGNALASFGVVGYIPSNENPNPLKAGANGVELAEPEYTIHASVPAIHSGFDFIIRGLSTDAKVSLVMCAYIYDGSKIVYLGNGTQAENATTITVLNGQLVAE